MDAAEAQSAPDRERAETYLRLRAEAELRTALRFPRLKEPRERGRPARMMARARVRRQRALVHGWVSPAQATRPTAGHRIASRVWQPIAPAWHRIVFSLWRRYRRSFGRLRRRNDRAAPGRASVERTVILADALAAAGALSYETAESVVADLRTALAARSLIEQHELLADDRHAWSRHAGAVPGQAAAVRAVPVGALSDCQLDDRPSRAYLGALILDAGNADLTVTIKFGRPSADSEGQRAKRRGPHPMFVSLDGCTAIDDRGNGYQAHFSGGGGDERWDGTFHLHPNPPAATRWLDFTLPGGAPVRVDLTTRPVALPTSSTSLPADTAADRYLDGLTIDLLRAAHSGFPDDPDIDAVTAAVGLVDAGVLTADSRAVRRLAVALRRTAREVPASLASPHAIELPSDWLSLLARLEASDGPSGAMPVAATMPELDGIACMIAELTSEPNSASMRVYARGWPMPRHYLRLPTVPSRWTARDDLGGWYVADEKGFSGSDREAKLELGLIPAINPSAGSLQIILTTMTGEVSVTVPLNWQEGL